MIYDDDNFICQASLGDMRSHSNGLFGFNLLVVGVVVAVYFPDDTGNKSKAFIEYDVDPTNVPIGRIFNAPRLDYAAGHEDFDINVLVPASKMITGGNFESYSDRCNTNGDRVVVGFLGGGNMSPVIIGALPHRLQINLLKNVRGDPLHAKPGLSYEVHRGTEIVRDIDGNVLVDFGPHPSTKEEKKKFVARIGDLVISADNTSSPTTVTIKDRVEDKDVVKVTKDSVELGVNEKESQVLGDTYRKEESAMLKELSSDLNAAASQLEFFMYNLSSFLTSLAVVTEASKASAVGAAANVFSPTASSTLGQVVSKFRAASTKIDSFEAKSSTYLSEHNKVSN